MTTAITSILIRLLLIFILPFVPCPCKQTTPKQKTQAAQKGASLQSQAERPVTRKPTPTSRTPKPRAQVKKSVFAEWKSMRARRVPVGTEVRWRLQVYFVYPDIFYAYLEGNHNYRVFGTRMVAPREAFIVAVGDWVEVLGKYAGVGHDGKVQLALYELTNLGPRD